MNYLNIQKKGNSIFQQIIIDRENGYRYTSTGEESKRLEAAVKAKFGFLSHKEIMESLLGALSNIGYGHNYEFPENSIGKMALEACS